MIASMLIISRTHCSVSGFGDLQRNSSIHFVTAFQVHSPPGCGKDGCVCRAQTCPGHVHMWVDMKGAALAWGPEGGTCCDCPAGHRQLPLPRLQGLPGGCSKTAQNWDGHRALAGGLKCCLGSWWILQSPPVSHFCFGAVEKVCSGLCETLTCITSVLWVASKRFPCRVLSFQMSWRWTVSKEKNATCISFTYMFF